MTADPSRSFAVSVLWLTIVRLIGLAAAFAAAVLGARLLGQAGFGAAGVAITVGMVAAIVCNGGVNIAVISLAGRYPQRRAQVLAATALTATLGAIASALIAAALAVVASTGLGLPGRVDLFAAAALVAAGIVAFEFAGSALLALNGRRAYAIADLVRGVGLLAAAGVLLALWRTDTAFVLATGVAYVGAAAVALGVAHGGSRALIPAWHPELMRRGLAIGLRGQAGNVLQFLNLRLDLLLIPVLVGLPAAGIYLVAVRVSEVIGQVPGAVGSLIFPAVAQQDDPRSTALTERAIRMSMLVVGVAGALIVIAADPLIALVFGSAFGAATPSLRILALAIIPLSVARIMAADLKGRGRPGLVSLVMLATLVVTIALDLALIPPLGIAGAAIASLAAYTCSAALLVAAFAALTGSRLRLMLPGPADVVALARATRQVVVASR